MSKFITKLLSISIFAICFLIYIKQDFAKCASLGKDAYLAHEIRRFDHYVMHPPLSLFLTGAIAIFVVFGLYELIAFLLYQVIERIKKQIRS